MAAVARNQITLHLVLILCWIAISTPQEVQKVEVDVCSDPYPPMPNFYYSETETNGEIINYVTWYPTTSLKLISQLLFF